MRRAIPDLRELDRREADCRRTHRRGSAAILKAKKQAVSARIAAEIGRKGVV